MAKKTLTLPVDAKVIDASLFLPEGAGPHPAVVLLTDIRGSRPVYDSFASLLAVRGFAVLVPNLYYRSQTAPVVEPGDAFDDTSRTRLQGYRALLTPEALAQDFDAWIAALKGAPEIDDRRIGVVGYCMSGAFALRFAAAFPAQVLAAASFHGGNLAVDTDPASPHLLADRIAARLHIGHADEDASAPPEQIARLDEALAKAGRDFTTEFYAGAKHGFAIPDSAAYDDVASTRHLGRLNSLFEETLLPG